MAARQAVNGRVVPTIDVDGIRSFFMKTAALGPLFGFLIALAGCGSDTSHLPATVPAAGIVTLDGKPVPNAAVSFVAETGTYHATALTDASGKFQLRAFQEKEGAVPGPYKVEVNQTVLGGGQDAGTDGELTGLQVNFGLPQKYATVSTSGLTYTIPEGGQTDIKLELTSK
jgi:hypothetical protein